MNTRRKETRPDDVQTVAICMATYNPPPGLLARQLQSIREQTLSHWICLINDDYSSPDSAQQIHEAIGGDGRFVFRGNASRQGVYHNFESCLKRVPEYVSFVALADQDDYWYPEKLATLLTSFDEETMLVYSDMNVVDPTGRKLAKTFWTKWGNQSDDLMVMIMANTVTGAASMFRRGLLKYLLPFPERVGDSFHDHWIACAALALGKIRYLDQQLYDYVQHANNVNGFGGEQSGIIRKLSKLGNWLSPKTGPGKIAYWYHGTSDALQRGQLIAQTLDERCAGHLTPDKQEVLRLVASGEFTRLPWKSLHHPNPPLYYRGLLETTLSTLKLRRTKRQAD